MISRSSILNFARKRFMPFIFLSFFVMVLVALLVVSIGAFRKETVYRMSLGNKELGVIQSKELA